MVKKLQRKLDRAIIDARIKKSEILSGEFLKKEDGMETLETILLVVVSIIVVGVIINVLTKSGFKGENDKDVGLVGYIFYKIKLRLDALFEGNTTGSGNGNG